MVRWLLLVVALAVSAIILLSSSSGGGAPAHDSLPSVAEPTVYDTQVSISSSPPETSDRNEAWVTHYNPAGPFSIALPAAWKQEAPLVYAEYPDCQPVMQARYDGVLLVIWRHDLGDWPFATGCDMDLLRTQELGDDRFRVDSSQAVELAAGTAERFEGTWNEKDKETPLVVYLIGKGQFGYCMDFHITSGEPDEYVDQLWSIANTFRFRY